MSQAKKSFALKGWEEGFLDMIKIAQGSPGGSGPAIASTLPQPAPQPYKGMTPPDNSLLPGLPSLSMTDQRGTAQVAPGVPGTTGAAGAKPTGPKPQQGYNPKSY